MDEQDQDKEQEQEQEQDKEQVQVPDQKEIEDHEKNLDRTVAAIRRHWRKTCVNKIAFVNRNARKTYTISFGKRRITAWIKREKDPGNPTSVAKVDKGVLIEILDTVWNSWDNITVFSNGRKVANCNANDVFYFIQYIEHELRKTRELDEGSSQSPSSPRAVKKRILDAERKPEVDIKNAQFGDILDMFK